MNSFAVLALAIGLAGCNGSSLSAGPPQGDAGDPLEDAEPPLNAPAWVEGARVLVRGQGVDINEDCRTKICRHNENTDLVTFQGSIFLVHRTAVSQVLGPDSALHIYKSTDGGATFAETARIEAPSDRDLRDPHFFEVGGVLHMIALTRLPVASARDSNVDTVAVVTKSTDGITWSPLVAAGPNGWSFWRVREHAGVYYTAAYQDGDKSIVLFSSTDGVIWKRGATIYDVSADTPLETELTFMPSGRVLALVRMDGLDRELLGDEGRLRTKICWSLPPYDAFSCPDEIAGQRLDGPVSFFHDGRLFVVARKHLQGTGKKRTALFELTGNLEGGPLALREWGELPSAGDTSYAGVARIDDARVLVTWYSGARALDRPWVLAMFDPTDIWQASVNFSLLK